MTSPNETDGASLGQASLQRLFYVAVGLTLAFFAMRLGPRVLPAVAGHIVGFGMILSCLALIVAALRSTMRKWLRVSLVLTGGMPLTWLMMALAHEVWLEDLLAVESPNWPPPLPPPEAFESFKSIAELVSALTLPLLGLLLVLGFVVGAVSAAWMFYRGRTRHQNRT